MFTVFFILDFSVPIYVKMLAKNERKTIETYDLL